MDTIFSGNMITLDMFCNAFYQPKDFFSVSHGRVNILIPKFNMNKFNALFICTVINAEKIKYSYGRGMYSTEAENLYIKLPFTYDANHKKVPDYDYMEDYMKSMPFGDRI